MSEKLIRVVNPSVAGIDIGSRSFFVCVKDGEVKEFETYTKGCKSLIEYLKEHDIPMVVMESTGIYSQVLMDFLLKENFQVHLVNPQFAKAIPGKKSDVKDCQWLRSLGMHGLVRGSFILSQDYESLRAIVRSRQGIIKQQASQINKMQKALTLMNIRLTETISDIMGASGRKIIEGILAGERNPEVLVSYCHGAILMKKKEKVIDSLEGNYKKEYLFILKQTYDTYVFFESQLLACDKEIELELQKLSIEKEPIESENK